MIRATLHLSRTEAARINRAAEAADSPNRVAAGDNKLPRGDWLDFAKWLEWAGCDLEIERELSERKALTSLAARIERVVDDVTRAAGDQPAEVVPDAKPAGCLF